MNITTTGTVMAIMRLVLAWGVSEVDVDEERESGPLVEVDITVDIDSGMMSAL